MKNLILILFLSIVLAAGNIFGQVLFNNSELPLSINENGNAPESSAILDIQSTSKGILIPRMNSINQSSLQNPSLGLLIFNSDHKLYNYWDGNGWSDISINSRTLQIDTNSIGDQLIQPLSSNNNLLVGYDAGKLLQFGQYNGDASSNTFVGYKTGRQTTTGSNNTFIGSGVAQINSSGYQNTFIGAFTGGNNSNGANNVFIGMSSGYYNTNGHSNTFLGTRSGEANTSGYGNIFLGFEAGVNHSGSNKLYIESAPNWHSDNNNPLIYGEFDTNKVHINGSFHVRDALQLIPQSAPSGTCASSGEMIYGDDEELYLCKGGTWKQLLTN